MSVGMGVGMSVGMNVKKPTAMMVMLLLSVPSNLSLNCTYLHEITN